MKHFCFTVDDNIRFLKEISANCPESLFDHPYLALYRHLHEVFGLKVQLNLFYRMEGFDLSKMSDAYAAEWEANADWLKLSFHSARENVKPYVASGYDEVSADCRRVQEQILRFASAANLAKTTTVHYCELTDAGLRAMADEGTIGLLGLFGDRENPRTSYGIGEGEAAELREGEIVKIGLHAFAAIDLVLNSFSTEMILKRLAGLKGRSGIRVMIHEQYFYPDYHQYQPDFEEKLRSTFLFLTENGYESRFFENLL